MGGQRKVIKISEITGMENDVIAMHDIFGYKQTGLDKEGRAEGFFVAARTEHDHEDVFGFRQPGRQFFFERGGGGFGRAFERFFGARNFGRDRGGGCDRVCRFASGFRFGFDAGRLRRRFGARWRGTGFEQDRADAGAAGELVGRRADHHPEGEHQQHGSTEGAGGGNRASTGGWHAASIARPSLPVVKILIPLLFTTLHLQLFNIGTGGRPR